VLLLAARAVQRFGSNRHPSGWNPRRYVSMLNDNGKKLARKGYLKDG